MTLSEWSWERARRAFHACITRHKPSSLFKENTHLATAAVAVEFKDRANAIDAFLLLFSCYCWLLPVVVNRLWQFTAEFSGNGDAFFAYGRNENVIVPWCWPIQADENKQKEEDDRVRSLESCGSGEGFLCRFLCSSLPQMVVSSACCNIIYDSLFWLCQSHVRVINISQVFSGKRVIRRWWDGKKTSHLVPVLQLNV